MTKCPHVRYADFLEGINAARIREFVGTLASNPQRTPGEKSPWVFLFILLSVVRPDPSSAQLWEEIPLEKLDLSEIVMYVNLLLQQQAGDELMRIARRLLRYARKENALSAMETAL